MHTTDYTVAFAGVKRESEERRGNSTHLFGATRFAAGLDTAWMAEVADCALDYLATCGRRHHRRWKRTDWNWN